MSKERRLVGIDGCVGYYDTKRVIFAARLAAEDYYWAGGEGPHVVQVNDCEGSHYFAVSMDSGVLRIQPSDPGMRVPTWIVNACGSEEECEDYAREREADRDGDWY